MYSKIKVAGHPAYPMLVASRWRSSTTNRLSHRAAAMRPERTRR